MTAASTFQYLKPICVPLVRSPTFENLTHALNKFGSLANGTIEEKALLEYVIFPFKLAFQNVKLGENEEILCFQCLSIIFSKCKQNVFQTDFILWVFNVYSIYFTPKELLHAESKSAMNVTQMPKKSEEQKLATIDMLSSLLNSSNDSSLDECYENNKNLPLIGHVFAITLQFIESERNKTIQVKAMMCLKLLSGSNVKSVPSTVFLDCVSSFFPGIALTFNNFFTSTVNQSTNLLVPALQTFAFISCLVLNDNHYPTKMNIRNINDLLDLKLTKKSPKTDDDDGNESNRKIQVKRDKEWFENTSSHMKTLFQNFLPIVMMHDNVRTRATVIIFIENILQHCSVSLKSSIPDLLDVLAKFLSDPYTEIKESSRDVLEKTKALLETKGDTELMGILQQKLHSLFLSLPRIMNSVSDKIKLANLCIIKGYLIMFGKSFEEFLYSTSHLKTFFASLLQVLEFETQNITLVEEKTQTSRLAIDFNVEEETSQNSFYNKRFRHFHDVQITDILQEIIQMVVKNGDIDLILDHLMSECVNNLTLRLQSVFVLNEVIKACQNHGMEISTYIDQITFLYLQEPMWKVPITNDHLKYAEEPAGDNVYSMTEFKATLTSFVIPFETLNSNVQLISLLLEGFSVHARVLRTDYNIHLIQTLYPILEKVGSVNATISMTALKTLSDIARYCQYESVSDLILFNSDYLINAVTLQFRHLVHGSAAPAVLSVILRLCDQSIMPIVCDATEDLFANLDEYQEEVGEMMLDVLKYFNIAVDKWYNIGSDEKVGNEGGTGVSKQDRIRSRIDVNNNEVSVGEFFKEYSELSSRAHGFVDENSHVDDGAHEEGMMTDVHAEDEKKEEIPTHFQVVIKALDRCRHYNAANDRNVRLKSLEVTFHGVVALRQRENDLLPALHKLWPSIIARLKDKDEVVVLKCLDVVSTMVKYSSDFLRKRMTTEFLPAAIQFLKEHQASYSKNKSKYLQLFKVLEKLVGFLGDVLMELDVGLKEFCGIATICALYLDCKLHESVQHTAVSTMKKLSEIRPDVIWLLINSLYGSDNLKPPNTLFSDIILPEKALVRNPFSDNVMKIYSTMRFPVR